MFRAILLLVLVLLGGCIDPVDLKNNEPRKHLVVEGSFTNEAGLNYVRLSYSQPFLSPYNEFETKAKVTVLGDNGESHEFAYDQAGYYYPVAGSEARGILGHTYTLNIKAGGQDYQSAPTKLRAPVPIDAVHFEVDEQSYSFKGARERKLYTGYKVLVDYQDPAEEKNYLRWTFATTYEVSTQPWDYINSMTGQPAPKGCCVRCFLSEKLEQFKVIDDRLTNGKNVLKQNVLFIPFEKYLGVKNKLKVYQYSITNDAYNFFRILEQQKRSTGTVFDPPPAEVKGNMRNVSDEEEQVLGYFDVSGVSVKEVIILRENINSPVPSFIFPDDCQELPGATRNAPEDW